MAKIYCFECARRNVKQRGLFVPCAECFEIMCEEGTFSNAEGTFSNAAQTERVTLEDIAETYKRLDRMFPLRRNDPGLELDAVHEYRGRAPTLANRLPPSSLLKPEPE